MTFFQKFFIYNKNISFFIFILIYVKAFSNHFLKIKVLSSGEYFVIFENSINIYNSNFTNCSTIFHFNNSEIKPTFNNISNITISEYIQNDNKKYILCLIKTNLFIYDYINKNMTYHSLRELFSYNKDKEYHYFNFIPYNIDNNDK